jgi:peptide/nickel transport system substrate-binding protein
MRDKSKVWMDVRTGVIWYDGSPMTPEDVVWSFTHAGSPKSRNPMFIWCGINNFKIDGNRIIADVVQYNPVLFKWMAFLSAYVLPKAYYEMVGPEGLEKRPVGTGPLFDAYEGDAYLRLKADPYYWGAKHLRSTPSCSNSFQMRSCVLPKSKVAHQI